MKFDLKSSLVFIFLSIVTVIVLIWLGSLSVPIINGADKALFKQANVFSNSSSHLSMSSSNLSELASQLDGMVRCFKV
jgi:hypothetical protein